jgi:hypothetical protein
MHQLSILYQYPIWVSGLFFLAILLVSLGVGFLIGRHNLNSLGKSAKRGKNDVVLTGMFALLALILAFTYAFSLSRYDARKQSVMMEANALSTAFLRADLTPEPVRQELKSLLLEYARTRVISGDVAADRELLFQQVARSLEIQEKLWPAALNSIDGGESGPKEISLLHSINDVLDAHTRRAVNGYDLLPTAVLLLMLTIASGALGVAGYNSGVAGHEDRWGLRVLSLLLAIVMLLITDFDRSQVGFVRLDQQPLIDSIKSMESHLKQTG